MEHNITYEHKSNDIECICYYKSTQCYPKHTHANHVTIGYVRDGVVCVTIDKKEHEYHAGEYFCIMPDVPHEIGTKENTPYSMICLCIPKDKIIKGQQINKSKLSHLKQMIWTTPEDTFAIEDMARSASISPYHMIRKFKNDFGLTPHQFQIQCRIRKAQKLLEDGKSVIEVAYATGFCDQSHFDRCFRKIVGLTPSAYKQVAR